nr:Ig-like domain-containing protein [Amycolatopsis marina]
MWLEPIEQATTSVTATPAQLTYGQESTVDVMVESENPVSGSVELLDGDRVLGTATVAENGAAAVTMPGTALVPGNHELSVRYSGDEANLPAVGAVAVEVAKASTGVTGDTARIPFRHDSSIDLTITSAVPVSGTVELLHRGRLVATATVAENGTVSVTIPDRALKPGRYELSVRYSGDELNAPAEGTVEVQVGKAKVIR